MSIGEIRKEFKCPFSFKYIECNELKAINVEQKSAEKFSDRMENTPEKLGQRERERENCEKISTQMFQFQNMFLNSH